MVEPCLVRESIRILTLPDIGILTLINVSGFVSRFLKSDTQNKSVQNPSFIIIIICMLCGVVYSYVVVQN